MRQTIESFLASFLSPAQAEIWSFWVSLLVIALLAWLAYELWARLLMPCIRILALRTPTDWDDAILNDRVLRAVGQLLPALIVSYYLPSAFLRHSETTFMWIDRLTDVYIVWAVWFLVMRLLKSFYIKLIADGHLTEHASKGLLQMFQIILFCVCIVIAVSILFGKSPSTIVTALGATSAVLMLVFKDPIMGLVSGVQLSANKMLKKGDWIIVDKAGVNGWVEDVSLITVKVRNWDESVSTIPPYMLISESFQNYSNLAEVGARRVMRSIYIDVNTVRFLSPEELDALRRDGFIPADFDADASRVVNLRLFRLYLESMLRSLPEVRADMRLMVRQKDPTPAGLPLELFFFVRQTVWEEFEAVQSNIFDQVYAVINRFGLAMFQTPAGSDLSRVTRSE